MNPAQHALLIAAAVHRDNEDRERFEREYMVILAALLSTLAMGDAAVSVEAAFRAGLAIGRAGATEARP